jgi:hypothetical protein
MTALPPSRRFQPTILALRSLGSPLKRGPLGCAERS